jgi:glucokinase
MNGPKDVTGIPGSIEYFIGNYNIAERTGGRFPTTHALIEAYAQGDHFAAQVWSRSIQALACTISTYANVFDPEAVYKKSS